MIRKKATINNRSNDTFNKNLRKGGERATI